MELYSILLTKSMYEAIHWIFCPRWMMGELWGEVFDRGNIDLNGTWGSWIGGHQDRGAMKISSDGRAPLNVIDVFWAMHWNDVGGSGGVGQIYVWSHLGQDVRSTNSSSGNVKVIVGISLLGMMAGSFIGGISVDILGVWFHHHFWNTWKVPTLHWWSATLSIKHSIGILVCIIGDWV